MKIKISIFFQPPPFYHFYSTSLAEVVEDISQ